jgi:hypothetical protein
VVYGVSRKEAGRPGCGTVNKETVSDRVPRSPIHMPVRREPSCPDPSSGWVLEERAQYRNIGLDHVCVCIVNGKTPRVPSVAF